MLFKESFFWVSVFCGFVVLGIIIFPLFELLTAPSFENLIKTIKDKDVIRSIWLSLYTGFIASSIAFIFGTPFAYLLARREFFGKRLIEALIDIPIVIPHPVVGIAILSFVGRNHWLGKILLDMGIKIMGSTSGIILVLVFVGMPFYINSVKEGFESISPRLEKVSRSLGASISSTIIRVTLPLAWRSIVVGLLMCTARALSEFGAIVIVAYHPMVASVMIYERFEAYGLEYSQPVAFWLVFICLTLFLILRFLTLKKKKEA